MPLNVAFFLGPISAIGAFLDMFGPCCFRSRPAQWVEPVTATGFRLSLCLRIPVLVFRHSFGSSPGTVFLPVRNIVKHQLCVIHFRSLLQALRILWQVGNRVSWLLPRFQELGSPSGSLEDHAPHRSVLPDFQALFVVVVWMMVLSILSCHLGIANTVGLMAYSSGLSWYSWIFKFFLLVQDRCPLTSKFHLQRFSPIHRCRSRNLQLKGLVGWVLEKVLLLSTALFLILPLLLFLHPGLSLLSVFFRN